jgi:hypothetical protein
LIASFTLRMRYDATSRIYVHHLGTAVTQHPLLSVEKRLDLLHGALEYLQIGCCDGHHHSRTLPEILVSHLRERSPETPRHLVPHAPQMHALALEGTALGKMQLGREDTDVALSTPIGYERLP